MGENSPNLVTCYYNILTTQNYWLRREKFEKNKKAFLLRKVAETKPFVDIKKLIGRNFDKISLHLPTSSCSESRAARLGEFSPLKIVYFGQFF
jgi:hypothetical protein